LTLPKSLNSLAIAQQVTRRAATWRLTNDLSLDERERDVLEQLARTKPLTAKPKAFAMHTMPSWYPASPANAVGPVGRPANTPPRDAVDATPEAGVGATSHQVIP
jgi:hypothetical protein